jgi:hypothetical protein
MRERRQAVAVRVPAIESAAQFLPRLCGPGAHGVLAAPRVLFAETRANIAPQSAPLQPLHRGDARVELAELDCERLLMHPQALQFGAIQHPGRFAAQRASLLADCRG